MTPPKSWVRRLKRALCRSGQMRRRMPDRILGKQLALPNRVYFWSVTEGVLIGTINCVNQCANQQLCRCAHRLPRVCRRLRRFGIGGPVSNSGGPVIALQDSLPAGPLRKSRAKVFRCASYSLHGFGGPVLPNCFVLLVSHIRPCAKAKNSHKDHQ